MKLNARDAGAYIAAPDPKIAAVLLYGPDAMRVALKRQDLIARIVGPDGDTEMRLSRIAAADLRKDPALLGDAVRAQGFFPGARVAFVEDAGDGLSKTIGGALEDWALGDATIVVTAGQLTTRSALRKLFESHSAAVAIGIYADPPTRGEIEATLNRAGIIRPDGVAMDDLVALARDLDPGDFRQTIEKLALYKYRDATPPTSAEIAEVAPTTSDADVDDILSIVADGRTEEIGTMLRRLAAQGVQPVSLCIGAVRHFRTLHAAAADPGGPAAGIGRARPPVFGPRRDRMVRQASAWGLRRLEQALTLLTDTDLTLRSASRAPTMPVMERTLIRLAMLARR